MMQDSGVDLIDSIEIAVNGAELQVLYGMENMLKHTMRLFVKGHARMKGTGEPINKAIVSLLSQEGFKTKITKRSKSQPEAEKAWGMREGDVYAWKGV
jgi:hypothetical protein